MYIMNVIYSETAGKTPTQRTHYVAYVPQSLHVAVCDVALIYILRNILFITSYTCSKTPLTGSPADNHKSLYITPFLTMADFSLV